MLNDIFNKENISKLHNIYVKLKVKIQKKVESNSSPQKIDDLTNKINNSVNNLINKISTKVENIDTKPNNFHNKKNDEWKVQLEIKDISSKSHVHKNNAYDKSTNQKNKNSKDQLSYGEIVFLDWCSNNKYEYVPSYFFYEFDIDTNKALKFLIKDGLLVESSDEQKIKYLTVAEIKNILRQNHIKMSGKKQELINRLKDNIDVSKYSDQLNFLAYSPTEKGKKELDNNGSLIWARKKNFVSMDMSEVIGKNKQQIFKEIEDNIKYKIKENNIHELYFYLLDAFKIVNSNKNYEYALTIQIMASIICLSGLVFPCHDFEEKGYFPIYEASPIKPQINKLKTLKRRNKLSDNDMINLESKIFDEFFKNFNQPVLFNSKEEYLQLMQYSYSEDDDKLDGYIKELFKKLPEKYRRKDRFRNNIQF